MPARIAKGFFFLVRQARRPSQDPQLLTPSFGDSAHAPSWIHTYRTPCRCRHHRTPHCHSSALARQSTRCAPKSPPASPTSKPSAKAPMSTPPIGTTSFPPEYRQGLSNYTSARYLQHPRHQRRRLWHPLVLRPPLPDAHHARHQNLFLPRPDERQVQPQPGQRANDSWFDPTGQTFRVGLVPLNMSYMYQVHSTQNPQAGGTSTLLSNTDPNALVPSSSTPALPSSKPPTANSALPPDPRPRLRRHV